jgi:two-component system, OmpR family, sensor kinase
MWCARRVPTRMADGPVRVRRRLRGLLNIRRWPVRWRLAAVSAALTFVILVVFAVVVGRLTETRLQADFNDELRDTASHLSFQIQTGQNAVSPDPQMTLTGDSAIRVVNSAGSVYRNPNTGELAETQGAPDLGPPPRRPAITEAGSLRVATWPVQTGLTPPLYLQYARSTSSLDATIHRLWLFLALGVFGGTLMAALAGIAIAGRAMRPIAALTGTARQIAFTRDPSRRVPQPETDDEVAELARTLEQMLRQLDAARSETEQMIQVQREFVADASHELRTPLTSILANLELLNERLGAGQDEEEEIVGSALRSSRRMSRLVSDLLLLARADAGRTGARRECDLGEIAAAAAAEVRPVSAGHEITMRLDGAIPVMGNADELHRLVLNLLDNAIRHTPTGTPIALTAARRDGEADLEISDEGPGIPAGMEDQIFSRFARGSGPADISADTGAGLGLAIVKAVATSHGGDVVAGRSPAGGARFTVTLPLMSAAGSNGEARRATAEERPESPTPQKF